MGTGDKATNTGVLLLPPDKKKTRAAAADPMPPVMRFVGGTALTERPVCAAASNPAPLASEAALCCLAACAWLPAPLPLTERCGEIGTSTAQGPDGVVSIFEPPADFEAAWANKIPTALSTDPLLSLK